MEIYAEVENFSFYQSSKNFYITVQVIEKRIVPGSSSFQPQFEEVKLGSSISLKADDEKIAEAKKVKFEDLATLLLNRFLIFEVNYWEPSQAWNKNSTPKFGIINARKCDILQGN